MKIGIVTLIGEHNYGNLLQSYALQTVLEQMGHNVVILNRRYSKPNLKLRIVRVMSFIKSIIRRYILGNKKILIVNPFVENYCIKDRIDHSELEKFVRNYLKRTLPLCSTDEMKNYARREQLDAYIVGSDQVWREKYVFSIEEMFLSFLPNNSKVKRIAYAASFGTDNKPISIGKLSVCRNLLNQFDLISVREQSAVNICKKQFSVEAIHVLDPTMLLKKDDYIGIFEHARIPKSKGSLLIYILDDNEEINYEIGQVAQTFNMVPFSVNALEIIESISYSYRKPSVESWLRGFYDAELVITDSFHACVFSIIFNKPFVCLGNKDRGNTRFESLLCMFGLEDRIVNERTIKNILNNPIDWLKVNGILEQKRIEAKLFLEKALKKH